MCEVIPCVGQPAFNAAVPVLNQYLRVVLDPFFNAFCWQHRGFSNPSVSPYLPDGVHVNKLGQYWLYRSYRDAMFHARSLLYFTPSL